MSTDTVICRSGDTQFYAPSLTLPRIAADSASTLDAEGSVAKREKEHVMVAEGMIRRGASIRKVAEQLGVTEGALRYRLRRRAEGVRPDGRSKQRPPLDGLEPVVHAMLEAFEDSEMVLILRPGRSRNAF